MEWSNKAVKLSQKYPYIIQTSQTSFLTYLLANTACAIIHMLKNDVLLKTPKSHQPFMSKSTLNLNINDLFSMYHKYAKILNPLTKSSETNSADPDQTVNMLKS